MSERGITEKIRNFIFEHVDSVEQLEILLLFYADQNKIWNYASLAAELRSNPNSVEQRCQSLKALNLIVEPSEGQRTTKSDHPLEFVYNSSNSEMNDLLAQISESYRLQKFKIFELIFSPMKKARDFANAFSMKNGKKEGKDG